MKKKSVLDLKRISQEEFKRVEKISLTVILDNVRSLNNMVLYFARPMLSEWSVFICAE